MTKKTKEQIKLQYATGKKQGLKRLTDAPTRTMEEEHQVQKECKSDFWETRYRIC